MTEGASEQEVEEILSGYPTLSREQLDLACIYAGAYPRRGRPPKHPWQRMEILKRASEISERRMPVYEPD